MPHNHFIGDPSWTQAPTSVDCRGCGEKIEKGDAVFFYPRTGSSFCSNCGQEEATRFHLEADAEYAVTGPEEYEPDDSDDRDYGPENEDEIYDDQLEDEDA